MYEYDIFVYTVTSNIKSLLHKRYVIIMIETDSKPVYLHSPPRKPSDFIPTEQTSPVGDKVTIMSTTLPITVYLYVWVPPE